MEKLPPELLLKIARYFDFEEICALSKVNRQWNEVIESNWNSLKKTRIDHISLAQNCQNMGRKDIVCETTTKNGISKHLKVHTIKGSENVDAADILSCGFIPGCRFHNLRPMDDDKFLEDLFAPIFARSTIELLSLILIIWRSLSGIVYKIKRVYQNPGLVYLHTRPVDHGPVPKCRYLKYPGSKRLGTSAFTVPDIVDLVEEWCNNKRDIVKYEFDYFVENINAIAVQFEQALTERNLPALLEVIEENVEFLIKKIATRGDKQDQLHINFGLNKRGAPIMFSINSFVIMDTGEGEKVK